MHLGIWGGFIALILTLLAIDLGLLNRKDHAIGFRESLAWTGVWVTMSFGFSLAVYGLYEHHIDGFGTENGKAVMTGMEAALLFASAYVVEYSLSVDNIFVIALIISTFKVPPRYQHRVLFWGILGALVLRGLMIAAGAALLHQFSWMMYVFGGILLLTAARMAFQKDESVDIEHSWTLKTVRRFYPVSNEFHGRHFTTRLPDGRRAVTPLLLVLLLVETTDVLFAVDSIPAVFSVTLDPFLVFTSNVFAILGLRSLYFALAGMMDRFHYLKAALVVLLAFIGLKMLLGHVVPMGPGTSFGIIVAILATGVTASLLRTPPPHEET